MIAGADQVVLRLPTSADVEAAARCHLACWQEAYAGLVDPELLSVITGDLDWAIDSWRRALRSDRTTTLAVDGELIVGFARGSRDGAGAGRDVAVARHQCASGLLGHGCRAAAAR
jgi:hypothetical protein